MPFDDQPLLTTIFSNINIYEALLITMNHYSSLFTHHYQSLLTSTMDVISSGLHRLAAGGADHSSGHAVERILRIGGEHVLHGSGPDGWLGNARKNRYVQKGKNMENPMEIPHIQMEQHVALSCL